jgi:uncharacterized protein YyaL (SSP411 family)
MRATHASSGDGAFTHGPRGDAHEALYLADNAAFGFALVRLHEATRKPEYLQAALGIARFLIRDLADTGAGGGFFASTPDPNAVGVFAARRKPFEDNVMAVRFLVRLARLGARETPWGDPSPASLRETIRRALPPLLARQAIEERGRMIGDLLLALDEVRSLD